MTTSYGALGQKKPGATTLTDAYAVPAAKHATIRIVACNLDAGSDTTIRVSIAVRGVADDPSQYVVDDLTLEAGNSKVTAPVTVGATDVVRVYSASGNVSFTVTGIEQDNE